MSARGDDLLDAASSPSWSVEQWLREQLIAAQIAEVLEPLSSQERHAVLAEVAILLSQSGSD